MPLQTCKYLAASSGIATKAIMPVLYLQTLVWTRGAGFPLARLESRLKCPRCGSRRVVLLFEPPSSARTRMAGVG
jgi:hypothetical protein